jgi:hypothetical protein
MRAHLSERLAVVATIDPDAYAAGTYDSDAVDMSRFDRAMFVLSVGEMGISGTVDFKLQESDQPTGPFIDIVGKSVAQLSQTAGDSDKQAIVEMTADELSEGRRYVRGRMTVGVAASDAALIALGGDPRNAPVTTDDLASVDEIVR